MLKIEQVKGYPLFITRIWTLSFNFTLHIFYHMIHWSILRIPISEFISTKVFFFTKSILNILSQTFFRISYRFSDNNANYIVYSQIALQVLVQSIATLLLYLSSTTLMIIFYHSIQAKKFCSKVWHQMVSPIKLPSFSRDQHKKNYSFFCHFDINGESEHLLHRYNSYGEKAHS